jgi:hypothetical protein
MIAEFDRNDPNMVALLDVMRVARLNDLAVLGGLLAVAYAADPNGEAVDFISNGGSNFASIAMRLGWSHDQLLGELVRYLKATHIDKTDTGAIHPLVSARLH